MRLQHHAEYLARVLFHFVDRFRELDAAALAAAAGMDLRFHHPHFAAELLRRGHRFVDAEARDAARRRDAVFAQDFFRLVFIYFYKKIFFKMGLRKDLNDNLNGAGATAP